MTTIVLPLTTKAIILEDVIEKFEKIFESFFNLIILCEKGNSIIEDYEKLKLKLNKKQKKNADKPIVLYNISLYIFPNGTKEDSMINTGILKMKESEFILIRNDVQEIDTQLLNDIKKEKNECEIVMAKQKKSRNSFFNFFEKLFIRIYEFIFNFYLYSGDIGVQYFSRLAHSIMRKIKNPIVLTKLNRWIGMKIKYIETQRPKTDLKEKNYGKNRINFLVFGFLFLVVLGVFIFLNLQFQLSLIVWLLIFFVVLIFLALSILTGVRVYLIRKIGEVRVKKSYIIEIKELF